MTPEGGGDKFPRKGGILHRLHDTGPFFFVVVEEHVSAGFEFGIVVGDVGFHVVVFVPRIDEDQVYGLVGKQGGCGGGVHDMELNFVVDSEGGGVVEEGFLVAADDFCHGRAGFTGFEERSLKVIDAVEGGAGGKDGGDGDAAAPLEGSEFDDGGVGGQLFDDVLEGDGFGKGEEAGDFFPE